MYFASSSRWENWGWERSLVKVTQRICRNYVCLFTEPQAITSVLLQTNKQKDVYNNCLKENLGVY